jgi:periplasmic protein TonB
MEPLKILQSDILDILFENRNQSYGAYELRKKFNKRMMLGLIYTFAFILFIGGAYTLAKEITPAPKEFKRTYVELEAVKPKPEEKKPVIEKIHKKQIIATSQLTQIVIKKDDEVKEDIPTDKDLDRTIIGSQNIEGFDDPGTVIPPDGDKQIITQSSKEREPEFIPVSIEASIDQRIWKRHLEKYLQNYIEDAAASGMQAGRYTVQVRFIVDVDGSISDVKALNDPGFGLAEGAVYVVKKAPKWNPAEQNGAKVKSYHTQPVTFVVEEE